MTTRAERRPWLARALVWVWAPSILVAVASLMAGHLLTLPSPARASVDRALEVSVQALPRYRSVATCFIARSFFDNVIGLEKIVHARTTELHRRNQDMRLVLDHVPQGFFSVDRAGVMSSERSAIVETWLGSAASGGTFMEYLSQRAPAEAANFALSFQQVIEDVLPLELALVQLPKQFSIGDRHFVMSYTPVVVAFVHVVRNAVDHGIEGPDSRVVLGKPAEGQLALSTRLDRDDFVVEIADDGRGIDWAAVAERARRLGAPHATEAELTEALFQDGVSTASDVGEISGRGIDMGAVRAACDGRAGSLKVTSRSGGGTRLESEVSRTYAGPVRQVQSNLHSAT